MVERCAKVRRERQRAVLWRAAFLALTPLSSALAVPITYTYTPAEATNTSGTADSWSAGTGWSAVPVSAIDATLVFNSPTTAVTRFTNNDIASPPFQLNVLTFQGTPPAAATSAITVQGSQLEFRTSGTGPFLNANTNRGTGTHTATLNNPIAIPDGLTIQGNGSATFVLGGAITGVGSLTKNGNSSVQINSTSNAWGGSTTITAGAIRLGASNVIPNGSAISISGTGVLDFTGKTETIASLALSGTGLINQTGGTVTISGAMTNNSTSTSGSGAAFVVNSSGTVTVNGLASFGLGSQTLVGGGSNTSLVFNGGLELTGATLRFNTGATSKLLLGTGSNVTVNTSTNTASLGSNATFPNPLDMSGTAHTFNVANGSQAVDLLVNLAVTNGSIIKTGEGAMSLANSSAGGNTFAGGTTVNAGSLVAAAAAALGTGNVAVNAAAANSANSVLDLSGAPSGVIADTATLTLTDDTSGPTPRYAEVAFGVSTLNETVFALILNGSSLPGGTYTAAQLPNNISGAGTITVVPEPASAILLVVGAPLLLRRRRRL